jgi:hypothetical protein
MKARVCCTLLILAGLTASVPAAAVTRVITAAVVAMSGIAAQPETTLFQINSLPAATGCAGANNGWFAFSPTTITDAQTRKNFVAYLIVAKTVGTSVLVVYDDAGGHCDPFGYPAPFQIEIL